MLTRRHVLASALAAPAILRFGTGTAHAATTLKISHQFPGGTIDKGDFRDRLCRMFAAEVAKRSGGDIAAEIYPNSSLIKTNAQFSAMRKGALDISLYPLPYAGGELPETNIGLMPGLVTTYDQGLRWKNAAGRQGADGFPGRQGHHHADLDLAGRRRRQPLHADRRAGRRQGPEGPRRLARDGHGAADRGRRRAVGAVERNLCGDADRRLRCRHHLLHQPDLVPARGSREVPDLGRRRLLLVHAGAADDVEGDLRQAAEERSRTSSSPSAPNSKPSARRARRTTISRSPRSTRRPAPRSASSMPRPSANGATSRATPRGRTTAPRRATAPIC